MINAHMNVRAVSKRSRKLFVLGTSDEFDSSGSFGMFAAIRRASSPASSHTYCQLPSSPLRQLECGRSELFDELVPLEVGMQVSEAADAYCTPPASTNMSAMIATNVFIDSPFLF